MAFAFGVPSAASGTKSDIPANLDEATLSSIVASNAENVKRALNVLDSLFKVTHPLYNNYLLALTYGTIPLKGMPGLRIDMVKNAVHIYSNTGRATVALNRRGLPTAVFVLDQNPVTAEFLYRIAVDPDSVIRDAFTNSYTMLYVLSAYAQEPWPVGGLDLDSILKSMAILESWYLDMYGEVLMPDYSLADGLRSLVDDLRSLYDAFMANATSMIESIPDGTYIMFKTDVRHCNSNDATSLSALRIELGNSVWSEGGHRYSSIGIGINKNYDERHIVSIETRASGSDPKNLDKHTLVLYFQCVDCIDDVRAFVRLATAFYRNMRALSPAMATAFAPPKVKPLISGQRTVGLDKVKRYNNSVKRRIESHRESLTEQIATLLDGVQLPSSTIFYITVSKAYHDLDLLGRVDTTISIGSDGGLYLSNSYNIEELNRRGHVVQYAVSFDATLKFDMRDRRSSKLSSEFTKHIAPTRDALVPTEILEIYESHIQYSLRNIKDIMMNIKNIHDKICDILNERST